MTRVLVVDDNRNDRLLLVKMLLSNKYEAAEARCGTEALESVKASKPDLIISDIMMPEMDGFTLLRELKKDEYAKDIPFVFYTAHYVGERDKELATSLGASRFIVKPVEPRDLLYEIEGVLKDYAAGQLKPAEPLIETEEEYLRKYSERLVRKLEEKCVELEDSKNFLDAVLENMDDGVMVFDADLSVTYCNNRMSRIMECGMVNGRKVPDLVYPLCILDTEHGACKPFEVDMLTRNGTKAHLEGIMSPIVNEKGELTAHIGVFRDVTERKRSEKTIRTQNRDLSLMYFIASTAAESTELDDMLNSVLKKTMEFLKITAGGIYLIDTDADEAVLWAHQGLPDGFVETVSHIPLDSPSVADVLASKEPLFTRKLPRRTEELVKAENDYAIENVLSFHLRSLEKINGFINLVVPAECEISPNDVRLLESLGNEVGVAVEQLLLREKTKEAYEKLKSLDRMKDEFLSNVSHELKTPLVAIKGYSELINDESLGALNEQQKKSVDAVVRNSERLSRLIDSLLHISLPVDKKTEYEFAPLQIAEVIDQSLLDMLPQIEDKCLTLKQDVPDDLPLINGNMDKLIQLVTNLICNATKFTPQGGVISIAAREDEEYLHITVSDTGIGIPEDQVSRLFDRFYQVDTSMTRRYGGTGLGLYISKTIVKMHNGEIWVKSEEGAGTTVYVMLPK